MFSEDPENFDPFLNSDSSTMHVVLVLTLPGFLLGIIISVIEIIVILVVLKNNQNNKRSY